MTGSDRDLVDQLKSVTNIVDVAEGYFPLTQKGERFLALCPFHREKTPSFSVHVSRQIFHCFGCGKGGDVLTLVMEMERISFPEALRLLADRAGIALPERDSGSPGRAGGRTRLLEVLERAAEFYQSRLASPGGKSALEYLERRGLCSQTRGHFGIGFAPDAWRELQEHLIGRGFSRAELLRAGLIKENESGNSWDLLRNRIVIPIRDTQARVIAFGGRVLDDSTPKYVNSPETELFSKKAVLFNFHEARQAASEQGFFVVVEGYMDVIAAKIRNVENVVAALGTAFTREHVQQMRRYAGRAVLLFDADAGGRRAADRSVSVLLEEGLEVQVVGLPKGQDPDDFFRENDRSAFENTLDQFSEDLLTYLVRRAREKYSGDTASATTRAAREVLSQVELTRDPILFDQFVQRISQEFGVPERLVRRESRNGPAPIHTAMAKSPPSKGLPGRYPKAWALDESAVLLGALTERAFANRVASELSESDFRDPGRCKVFSALCACLERAGGASPSLVLESLDQDPEATSALQAVLSHNLPPKETFSDALDRILMRRGDREYRRLREEASRSGVLKDGVDDVLDSRLAEFSRFHTERIARSKDVGNHSGSAGEQ